MQAVVVARFVFSAEVCVFWFIESGVFHELLFDFDFDFDFVFDFIQNVFSKYNYVEIIAF
jgi:hypothetical protein